MSLKVSFLCSCSLEGREIIMSEPIYIFAALGRNRKPRELESYCCEEMDGKMLPLSPL